MRHNGERRLKEIGAKASVGTFADAASFGEIVVLATLGVANDSALKMAGAEQFRGKVVIDTTNAFDLSGGMPPKLAVGGDDSAGERVQRLLPAAHVVKAFNTVGHLCMFRPDFPDGPPDMFIAGHSDEAKKRVGGILRDFGWGIISGPPWPDGRGKTHYKGTIEIGGRTVGPDLVIMP